MIQRSWSGFVIRSSKVSSGQIPHDTEAYQTMLLEIRCPRGHKFMPRFDGTAASSGKVTDNMSEVLFHYRLRGLEVPRLDFSECPLRRWFRCCVRLQFWGVRVPFVLAETGIFEDL